MGDAYGCRLILTITGMQQRLWPNPRSGCYLRKAGFTVLEMLVVIAVIGILAAMLWPVINSASESSNAAKCLGNLRQIASIMNLYISDNNGSIPPGRNGVNTGADTWYSNLTPYADLGKSNDKEVSQMNAAEQFAYNELWRKLSCPSLDRVHKSKTQPFAQGIWPSYGINLSVRRYNAGGGLQNWNNGKTRKLAAISAPSQTLAFIDTDGYEYTYEDAYLKLQSLWETYMPARHGGGYNGVFLDGHAEFLKSERVKDPDDLMWSAVR